MKKGNEAFAEWVAKVRGTVSQEKFAKMIYRPPGTGMGAECFQRTEVSNWELGKNMPDHLETIISIAL